MRLATITVTRTVQVKQYEPLVFSATLELSPDENPGPAATWLNGYVRAVLFDETQHMRADLGPRQTALFDGLPI